MLILPSRFIFFGDEIEDIQRIEPETGKKISSEKAITIFPANLFVSGATCLCKSIKEIQDDSANADQVFYR